MQATPPFCRFWIILLVITGLSAPVAAQQPLTVKGVSKALALHRAATLADLQYHLSLKIPAAPTAPISGSLELHYTLKSKAAALILDFNAPAANILSVATLAGHRLPFQLLNGHLVIPAAALKRGPGQLVIRFIAGNQSLNRNNEFLYSLFVPARASTAFPCFDQPDLKATFSLELEIPQGWVATSNGKIKVCSPSTGTTHYIFEPTQPISTYLFSFVAGKFKTIQKEHHGEVYTFYYREADSLKVARNTEAIFNQVFLSVDWMENYTGIKQPFGKYDFVAIPSFQYGGMEHPGAILYNAQRLILDESATQEDQLNRANLIAHETAHLWFGDLVTMKWFDDVWLKEVFANFMADKIVNPIYPGMNHPLRFLLAHQPRAYSIDRTLGANPIQQQLTNLAEAGSLYGNIIYHKSPVVMDQLEMLMGSVAFQKGLQHYLQTYRFSNATWDELIAILDRDPTKKIKQWSSVWVKEAGMPHYSISVTHSNDSLCHITIRQSDPQGKNRIWPQSLTMTLQGKKGSETRELFIDKPSVTFDSRITDLQTILPSSTERGYGYFELDSKSTGWLLQNMGLMTDPLLRGNGWLSLHEMMADQKIAPTAYLNALMKALNAEKEEQLVNFLVSDIQLVYWRYMNSGERTTVAETLPELLLTRLDSATTKSLKSTFLKAVINTTQNSCIGLDTLYAIWSGKHPIPGLKLSDNDFRIMACELALRNYPDSKQLLSTQIDRIKDQDLKERLIYLLPSLSFDIKERDRFFQQLSNPDFREHEPWTAEALGYLNHPLRASVSEQYILPGLNLLEQIRTTGDIFFPVDWLNALLSGHTSPEAAQIVRKFLKTHPQYPADLKLKILQSADHLLRINPPH